MEINNPSKLDSKIVAICKDSLDEFDSKYDNPLQLADAIQNSLKASTIERIGQSELTYNKLGEILSKADRNSEIEHKTYDECVNELLDKG